MKSTLLKARNFVTGTKVPTHVDSEYDQLYGRVDHLSGHSGNLSADLRELQNHLIGVATSLNKISRDFDSMYSNDPKENALIEQLRKLSGELNSAATVASGSIQSNVVNPSIELANEHKRFATLHRQRDNMLLENHYDSERLVNKKRKNKNPNKVFEMEKRITMNQQNFSVLNENAKQDYRRALNDTFPTYESILHNLMINMKNYGQSMSRATDSIYLSGNEIRYIPPISRSSHNYQPAFQSQTQPVLYPTYPQQPIQQPHYVETTSVIQQQPIQQPIVQNTETHIYEQHPAQTIHQQPHFAETTSVIQQQHPIQQPIVQTETHTFEQKVHQVDNQMHNMSLNNNLSNEPIQ